MPDAALDYGDPRGDDELRAELAAYLVRVRGRGGAPDELVVTCGYTQGLWLTCRALKARGARRGRGRGPVARRLLGDDPLRRAWRSSGVPVDEHGVRRRRAGRRRGARHARAPVPDRRGARARAAARAAGVGRDRDRGRLRLRVPLRPRAGRHAAAARARPRRLPRHGVEDARARRCGSAGCVAPPELAERDRRASAGRSTPAAPRSRARAYARLLATGEVDRHLRRTRREYRERRDRARRGARRRGSRTAASTGVAAGLHLLLRLPPGTDEAAVVARAGGAPDPHPRPRRLPARRRARTSPRS